MSILKPVICTKLKLEWLITLKWIVETDEVVQDCSSSKVCKYVKVCKNRSNYENWILDNYKCNMDE